MNLGILLLVIYITGIFGAWIINDTLIQLNNRYRCTDEVGAVLLVVFWPFVLVFLILVIIYVLFRSIIKWISKNIALAVQNIIRRR